MFEPREYRQLQTDTEFLIAVRQKIAAFEWEEAEQQRIKVAHKRFLIVRLKFYLLLALVNLPCLFFLPQLADNTGLLLLWGTLLLIIGSVYENLIETRGDSNGNQDYRFG